MLKTDIRINNSTEGETLEQKIERILNNKEPIKDSAELIYQRREEGVNPAMDIRTDRWDLAIDLADKGAADKLAKRKAALDKIKEGNDGKAEPADGQNSDPAVPETK